MSEINCKSLYTLPIQFYNIYVVVGISNSVLSILTANFPVRIEKKKFV